MNFKESFERYQLGTASEEEINYIEAELEKNELIQDYLGGSLELDLDFDIEKKQVKKVKFAVARKIITWVLTVVVVLVVLSSFIAVKMEGPLSSMYYDPNGDTVRNIDANSQFYLDMHMYSELFYPGYFCSDAEATLNGIGSYDVRVEFWHAFGQETYTTELIKGEFKTSLDDMKFFSKVGVLPSVPQEGELKGALRGVTGGNPRDHSYEVEQLKNMPESAFVSAYIGFETSVSNQDMFEIIAEYPTTYAWLSIDTPYNEILGMPFQGMLSLIIDEDLFEQYPSISLVGLDKTPELLKESLISRLSYLRDRPEFLEIMPYLLTPEVCQNIIDDIERFGLTYNGCLVQSSPSELLKLLSSEAVDYITIDKAKFSPYDRD
jgi:hypothetical protein